MVSPVYVVAKPYMKKTRQSLYEGFTLHLCCNRENAPIFSRHHGFSFAVILVEVQIIRICIPSETEQNEIADFIDEKSMEFDELIAKKEQFLSGMESYKK